MILDSHQHFWRLSRGDYGWIPPGDARLGRDHLPADLAPLLAAVGVDATIAVQAAPATHETDYLLGITEAAPFIAGVVGWIDFDDPAARRQLQRIARHPRLKGVRPLIQDIADVDWMLRPAIRWAFDAVIDLDLTFDALGYPIHLDNFARLFARHPTLRVVIDHGCKPRIRDGGSAGWAAGLARLARDTGALCKLSGLLTEAAPGADGAALRPYVDHILTTFGPDRVMWGSDWPVLTGVSDYASWFALARELVGGDAYEAVFGATAARFYRVPTEAPATVALAECRGSKGI